MDETIEADAAAMTHHEALARDESVARLDYVIGRAQQALIGLQREEGYWQAPLEANAQMNAEYIIFSHFMGAVDRELEQRLQKLLLELQLPDGSWNLYPGGEGYLSITIETYFALKLAGMRAGDEPLMRSRRWILPRGGVVRSGTLARFYLAAMGQVPWEVTPALPAEIALLPNWFPFNMYELSSWARGTLFALMVLQATRPVVKISYESGVLELYIEPPHFTTFPSPRSGSLFSLSGLLRLADKAMRRYNRRPNGKLRARALQYAEDWILEHQDANGSWGGIEPCYLLTAMALKGLGYRNDHPVLRKALSASRELVWEMGDKALYMPCVSPVWDTALAAKALLESGMNCNDAALRSAARWLVSKQIGRRGDWSIKRPHLEPGGWAFQFYNDWYPDVDDSAVVLYDLAAVPIEDETARQRALMSGANWVMGMQSRDGGFAAFDVDNFSDWLRQAPFADAEAVTDPTCPDLTGRVLEMMGAVGYRADHPVAARAIAWLKRAQSPAGSWWGRWGVNHVYGTFSVLAGLRQIGVPLDEPWIKRSVQWLKNKQNPDGGWGESCKSDQDPAWHGRGESTPSQTAWALIGLLSGEPDLSDSVRRGVAWLLDHQNQQGAWDESLFTGTGFPNHFYLRYHLYAHYFPLMALGRFRQRLAESAAH